MEYDHLPIEHQRQTLKNELADLQDQHWRQHRTLLQASSYDPEKHAAEALAMSAKAERDAHILKLKAAKKQDIFTAKLELGKLEHGIEVRRQMLAELPEPKEDESDDEVDLGTAGTSRPRRALTPRGSV